MTQARRAACYELMVHARAESQNDLACSLSGLRVVCAVGATVPPVPATTSHRLHQREDAVLLVYVNVFLVMIA